MSTISDQLQKMNNFFNTGTTLPISFRLDMLSSLYQAIHKYQEEIFNALYTDLNKSKFEAYATEVSIAYEEIKYAIKHLKSWSKPKRVRQPLTQFPGKSVIYSEPYGTTLIMAPWNYPFHLTIIPLIGSICGGNCTILKPSNYSPSVSKVISKIICSVFPPEYVTVIEGGREANTTLLEQKFDYIFFTGGVTVGKLVMEAAAKNLTPLSLELGGKSPCIVDSTADIELAAKRIAWGKFINAGQTCVAPDYVLVNCDVKNKLINSIIKWINTFHGTEPLNDKDYPKIITKKHFERLFHLIDGSNISNGTVVFGGNVNSESNKIEPTILDSPTPDSPIMIDEIFGPILPIIGFNDLNQAYSFVSSRPKPLALYFFSTDKRAQEFTIKHLSFGGGCINDVLSHLGNVQLPFGGVGNSGMGSYHGQQSFISFTHTKSIMYKYNWFDLPFRYQPYTDKKNELLQKILK